MTKYKLHNQIKAKRCMQIQRQSDFPASFPEPDHIIIDCDAGGDDAQALILVFHLAKKYNKKIVGVFCCEGNASIQNVVKNVLICKGVLIEHDEELKRNFPMIVRGASTTLLGQKIYEFGDDFFHKDGLCSNQEKYYQKVKQFFPFDKEYEEIMNRKQSSAELYSNLSKQYEGNIGIMAIGPLTNLGVAYHFDNDFPKRVSCLSIMGCQYSGVGMWDYFAADFNFALDPHSANLVIKQFDHIAIVSLQYAFAYITDRVEDVFLNKSTRKAELVADIYKPIIQKMGTAVLCDPQTAFPLFCKKEMKAKCLQIAGVVETSGKRTKGFFALKTPSTENDKKVIFITEMDKKFLEQEVVQSYSEWKPTNQILSQKLQNKIDISELSSGPSSGETIENQIGN